MRCDIHLHEEIKIKGQWHHYNTPDIERNYELFAKMAGVRNYEESKIEPISQPKGLPNDMSFVTRFCAEHYGEDGHSYSYLTAIEIVELTEWIEKQEWEDRFGFKGKTSFWFEQNFGYFFGNTYCGFTKYPEEVKHLKELGLEDIRFVFWFDN